MMRLQSLSHSLSARLLLLTIFFVMLAEVLIYTPSVARFRLNWLEDKLGDGHLAALAVVAAAQDMVTEELENELLTSLGAFVVDLRQTDEPMRLLRFDMPPVPERIFLLDEGNAFHLIRDAFDSMINGHDRAIRVDGYSPHDPTTKVMMIIDETPLAEDLEAFSWRILALSIFISLITAVLVYVSLHWLLVRPMKNITDKVVAFRDDPDDVASILPTSQRRDEIGQAQRALHDMQDALRAALKQRERLAAMGTAVTKVNHDLRNILSSASLVSERLAQSEDPKVRQAIPRLFDSIDRAVDLCSKTLVYTREGAPPLCRVPLELNRLVDEAEPFLATARSTETQWLNEVPNGLEVKADQEEFLRVLVNLARNAFQAGAMTVAVRASVVDGTTQIDIADDGPGLPPRAREHLFQPFAGSARPGGTGLGLAIAREIVSAHRGQLSLVESEASGTTFRITLPRRTAQLKA